MRGRAGWRCVGYSYADGGGAVDIGGDDGGEREVGSVDGGGGGGVVRGTGDAGDLAGDDFRPARRAVGAAWGDDGDVAEEVGFIGGVEDKLHALDGEVRGDVELGEEESPCWVMVLAEATTV